jgi:glutamate N-acetyltransferase/amino-acid N-acetyltransferase
MKYAMPIPIAYILPQITVDGDTSTNDTVIGLASGKSGAPRISDASSADGKTLEAALTALLQVRNAAT